MKNTPQTIDILKELTKYTEDADKIDKFYKNLIIQHQEPTVIIDIIGKTIESDNSLFKCKAEVLRQLIELIRDNCGQVMLNILKKPEWIFNLIKNTDELDYIALLAREYKFYVIDTGENDQMFSSPYQQNKNQDFQKMGSLINSKFLEKKNSQKLEQYMLIEPFVLYINQKTKEYLNSNKQKNTNQQQMPDFQNKIKDNLGMYQQRIKLIIDHIIIPFAEQLTYLTDIFDILVKYMIILDGKEEEELLMLDKLAKIIADSAKGDKQIKKYKSSYQDQQQQSSSNFNYLVKLLDYIIQVFKLKINQNDFLQGFLNLFLILKYVDTEDIKLIFDMYSTRIMYNFYQIEDIVTFFQNAFNKCYFDNTVHLVFYITQAFKNDQRFDILFKVYQEVILKNLDKIRCRLCMNNTIVLFNQYIFGFQNKYLLKKEDISNILANWKYITLIKNLQKDDIEGIRKYHQLLLALLNSNSFKFSSEIKEQIDSVKQQIESYQRQTLQLTSSKPYNLTEYYEMAFKLDEKRLDASSYDLILDNLVKPCGLENPGNLCYMNSFLQCLFMTPNLRKTLLKNTKTMNPGVLLSENEDPINALIKLFYQMLKGDQNRGDNLKTVSQEYVISTQEIKLSMPDPFKSSMDQQDASEFGRIYLDYIDTYIKNQNQDQESQIEPLFFGTLVNKIKCLNCKSKFDKNEKFFDLTVNFNENSFNKSKQTYDIKKMIQNIFIIEEFDENNKYYCEKCQKLVNKAQKETFLKKLPPYLIITINRFFFDQQSQSRKKITHKVDIDFDFSLDELFPTLVKNQEQKNIKYYLYAFIVHLGKSSDSGHYTAYTRDISQNFQSQKWFGLDDLFTQDYIAKNMNDLDQKWSEFENSYILFYANDKHAQIDIADPFSCSQIIEIEKKNVNKEQAQQQQSTSQPTNQPTSQTMNSSKIRNQQQK